MAQWQLLSNHGRVLVAVARDPGLRLRDIAQICDITERSAHRIVSELVEQDYLVRRREGSRNHYEIRPDVPIHDPLLGEHWVGEILAVLATSVAWASKNGDRAQRKGGGAERRRGDRRAAPRPD